MLHQIDLLKTIKYYKIKKMFTHLLMNKHKKNIKVFIQRKYLHQSSYVYINDVGFHHLRFIPLLLYLYETITFHKYTLLFNLFQQKYTFLYDV